MAGEWTSQNKKNKEVIKYIVASIRFHLRALPRKLNKKNETAESPTFVAGCIFTSPTIMKTLVKFVEYL